MRIWILSLVVACSSRGTPTAGSAEPVAREPTPPVATPDGAVAHEMPTAPPDAAVARAMTPDPKPAPADAAVARAMPTPDPITKPLTEDDARAEATRLARQAFKANPKIVDAAGKRVKTPAYESGRWTVKRDGQRWKLDIDPPAGAYAHVTIGAFAENPKVDVGYATE